MSLSTVWMPAVHSTRQGWAGHVARMRKAKNGYRMLVGNFQEENTGKKITLRQILGRTVRIGVYKTDLG